MNSTDSLKAALEPCPFCGGEAERFTIKEEGDNFGGDVICCKKCGASSHVEFGYKENLVDCWNRRAALRASTDAAPVADELKALIEAGIDEYAARCALRTEADGGFCHAYFYSDGQWRFQTGGNDVTIGHETVRCLLTKRLYAHPPVTDAAAVGDAAADLLTKAVGDITAALIMAGKQEKVSEWTAPYVSALNEHDAQPPAVGPVGMRETMAAIEAEASNATSSDGKERDPWAIGRILKMATKALATGNGGEGRS